MWKKSKKSSAEGSNCVEVLFADGSVYVRDSKDKGTGPELAFTRAEWDAFIDGAKSGEFDG